MELTAVLKALEYVEHSHRLTQPVQLYSDSQYVINLENRRAKLESSSYLTKSGQPVRNADLVKILFGYLNNSVIEFIKVAAHQKNDGSVNLNREVDKIARRIIREHLRQ